MGKMRISQSRGPRWRRRARTAAALLAMCVGAGEATTAVPPPSASGTLRVVGMTVPFRKATLASVRPARIARLLAREGASVRAGDVVVALDERVQRARIEIVRAQAASTLEVERTRVRRDRARKEWERILGLQGGRHTVPKELTDALAAAEVARLEHDLALFNREQAGRAVEREEALLAELSIRAPFDGYVWQRAKEEGESVDPLEGIVTLVQLDPLMVTADCPVALWPLLHQGDTVPVRPVDPRWLPRSGTIELVCRVVDGASQTVKVMIRVPNSDGKWLSGLKVEVAFTGDGTLITHAASPDSTARMVTHKERRNTGAPPDAP